MPHRDPERWLPHEGETPPETLARVCAELRDLVGAERVAVWHYDAPSRTVRPAHVHPAPTGDAAARRWRFPVDDYAAVGEVLDERTPVRITDGRRDPRVPGEIGEAFDADSYDLLPLVARGVAGMVAVEPAGTALAPDSTVDERLAAVLPFVAAATGQAQSWQESERRRRDTDLLLAILEEAASEDVLDDVLSRICARLARELRVHRTSIFLHEDGSFVPAMSRYGDGVPRESEWESFVHADEPFALGDEIVRSGEPLVIGDTRPLGDWWAEKFGVVSAVGVPIGTPANPVGVLVLDSPEPHRFTEDHARLAVAVGAHVAGLIDRARTAATRDEHLAVVSAVRSLLERTSLATSVQDVVDTLMRVTHEALRTEFAFAYLLDEDGIVAETTTVDLPARHVAVVRERAQADVAVLLEAIPRHAPLVVDATNGRRAPATPTSELTEMSSYVAVPVAGEHGPIGVVVASTSTSPRRWTPTDVRVAEQLTLEGSLVVENATLREADRRRLAEMSHRAFHDTLTGLPNRALLLDRVEHALARAERRPETVAVLFVDLDRFKEVNDSLGHEAGDRILVEVARRLEESVRPADTVARLAGDEFVVVLEDVSGHDESHRIARRIRDELARPFTHGGHEIHLAASVGIAVGVSDVRNADELIRRADRAMYRVKREGGSDHRVYDPAMDDAESGRLTLEAELHGALERGEIEVGYQPIVDLRSERIVGVEALARWRNPRLGLIDSRHFVDVADEVGLLPQIGARVIEEALAEHAAWLRLDPTLDLHVNVSARQLRRTGLDDVLRAAIADSRVPADRVVVELSEADVGADFEETAELLDRLRTVGARVGLDNFGAANSSLRYLQKLPVDLVKIDESFVDGVATEVGDVALVRAILDVSRILAVDVIAEGVETARQRDALVDLGCRRGQGYFFERPSTAARITHLIERQEQAGATPASSLGSGSRDDSGSR